MGWSHFPLFKRYDCVYEQDTAIKNLSDILPGLKFSRMISLLIASCFAKLSGKLINRNDMSYAVCVLSAFGYPQIDGDTLFVPSYASKPRTRSIYVELPPHT